MAGVIIYPQIWTGGCSHLPCSMPRADVMAAQSPRYITLRSSPFLSRAVVTVTVHPGLLQRVKALYRRKDRGVGDHWSAPNWFSVDLWEAPAFRLGDRAQSARGLRGPSITPEVLNTNTELLPNNGRVFKKLLFSNFPIVNCGYARKFPYIVFRSNCDYEVFVKSS